MSNPINSTEETSKSDERDNKLIRGSEVTELIDNKPGFLIRWGVSILFLAFVLILSATWFIRYPSTIIAKGILKEGNTPGSGCYVDALIPRHHLEDVKIGQEVFLKFEAYPHLEFGSVRGQVESITNSSVNEALTLKISLPGELTANNKSFLCHTGLLTEAYFIIDNQRLLEIIFKKVKK